MAKPRSSRPTRILVGDAHGSMSGEPFHSYAEATKARALYGGVIYTIATARSRFGEDWLRQMLGSIGSVPPDSHG